MRWTLLIWLVVSCKREPSSRAAEIADRGWRAHEIVVTAGEAAKTCAEAGVAMQREFALHRQEFVDAVELDNDKLRLREATEYLEAHQDRYADLETRMEALSERCVGDTTVQAAFRQMESP